MNGTLTVTLTRREIHVMANILLQPKQSDLRSMMYVKLDHCTNHMDFHMALK